MKKEDITITIKKRQLGEIRTGLNLLGGIKSVRLGIIRSKIGKAIEGEIEHINNGLKNEEFEKLQREASEVEAKFADDVARKTAELSAINRQGAKVLKDRNKQLQEYEKIMAESISLTIPELIPLSLLPEKETPNEAIELLMPVIDFEEKKGKKDENSN